MGLGDIFFIKLGLDGKNVQKGAFDVQKSIDKIGKSFVNQLAGGATSFIVSAVAGLLSVRTLIGEIGKAAEASALSERFKVSLTQASEMQAQAKALGISVEELHTRTVEFAKAGGSANTAWLATLANISAASQTTGEIIDAGLTQRLVGLQDQFEAIGNKAASVWKGPLLSAIASVGESISFVVGGLAKMSAFLGAWSVTKDQGGSMQSRALAAVKIAEDVGSNKSELDAIKKKRSAVAVGLNLLDTPAVVSPTGSFSGAKPDSDSLSRIGLFRGGTGDQTISILKQQVVQLQGIRTVINQVHSDLSAYDGADTLT